jgi:GNAT superfamily N-acetyltransferase
MVQIRLYEPSDAEAVSNVIRTTMRISNVADYPIERLQPLIDYFSPPKVEQLSHERDCLVAEEDGEIIGTAALEGDELVTFFVDPEHQGRGVGSALLKEIEAIALRHGRHELKVDASLAGTVFYERHGYERTGRILDGTAGPQISMRKPMYARFLGDNCIKFEVRKGLVTPGRPAPHYICIASYWVKSREEYGASLADPRMQEIMAQIASFTDIEPIRQFDEVVA